MYSFKLISGKQPVIDQIRPRKGKMMYGAPCGGLGAGTIGRGFRGEFCRWQIVPGQCDYNSVPADQFIVTVHNIKGDCVYQSVLGGSGVRPKGAPSSWEWRVSPDDCLYCALYPRSWTVYNIPEVGIRLICRQVSPVLPGDYKDSSLPASVFIFNVENNSGKELKVGITFSFKNGTGSKQDKSGGVWTESFAEKNVRGVVIHQEMLGNPVHCYIGAKQTETTQVSWCAAFDPTGSGDQIWQPLYGAGLLDSAETATQRTRKGEEVAAAVSARVHLLPGQAADVELCLVWHSPEVQFGNGLKKHKRYYTRHFGHTAEDGMKICSYALEKYPDWEKIINQWQEPTLENDDLPEWFKSAIFNELYFLADGGSVWLEVDSSEKLDNNDLRIKYGRWGYLEAQEYTMYNTYDVHYYASWALIDLFPGLQLSLQMDFLSWSEKEDKEMVLELYGGKRHQRKLCNSVPHDLGDPDEEPWVKVNSYNIHDVTEWKDLNLKLIIQTWRDIHWVEESEGKQLLHKALPVCDKLMKAALNWDLDRDGLIENSGFPDQTFDSWVMSGPSAYCGGLWLAALACMADMCHMAQVSHGWTELLEVAKKTYNEKLWNGKFFNFDSSTEGENIIMADQLAGYWYRELTGKKIGKNIQPILDDNKTMSAMKMIFDFNVMKFCNGELGAVNGMLSSGQVDTTAIQSEEVWTGVTYGVASLMLSKEMTKEGMKTAEGIYNTVYNTIGLGFETPEAIYEKKHYRAIAYMRPLSIWAMHIALNSAKV